ncbi:superfamily II DNA/RNA helicase [Luteococcus japonicus]|uniref:Superfamily II DNA/RNA helicase n=1 Tax=Luteococcus japonicus TaxID=33984 RepID=A0A3N1ZW79_9ACTN|nr:superfamily II DNA/RNA helicase [Luteococcus japonicus]
MTDNTSVPTSARGFVELGVPGHLATALEARGITSPTPIQLATLPDSLAGRDVLGRGRTGSGKTFAFLLPCVARLEASSSRRMAKKPRALILAPTRELATQIEESLLPLEKTSALSSLTIFGGVGQNPQVRTLAKGVDVLIACPGRLLDLMGQGAVDLSAVEICILDEADHMADMGFLPMVKRILDKVPGNAQKMLFSATLDNGIDVLVKRYLHQPVTHEADSAESPVGTMDHHVLEVHKYDKAGILADLAAAPGKTILFTRTKHGAKKLAKQLLARGIPAVDLHGNLAQNARTRNMEAFHSGRVDTLVATDIAARGIHVDDVELVVHADPPTEHKAYLHRSGRTARAGKAGTVVTMVTPDQRGEVRGLMRAAKIRPTVSNGDRATLDELAPGERTFLSPADAEKAAYPQKTEQQAAGNGAGGNAGGGRSRGGNGGRGRGGAGRGQGGDAQESSGSRRGGRGRGGDSADRPESRRGGQARPAEAGRTEGRRSGTPRRGASAGASSAGSNGGVAAFSSSAGRRGRR